MQQPVIPAAVTIEPFTYFPNVAVPTAAQQTVLLSPIYNRALKWYRSAASPTKGGQLYSH